MRLELGLNLPELRVGLSAHDFAQGLGAPDVVLSRAAEQAGAPTVKSRFVQDWPRSPAKTTEKSATLTVSAPACFSRAQQTTSRRTKSCAK